MLNSFSYIYWRDFCVNKASFSPLSSLVPILFFDIRMMLYFFTHVAFWPMTFKYHLCFTKSSPRPLSDMAVHLLALLAPICCEHQSIHRDGVKVNYIVTVITQSWGQIADEAHMTLITVILSSLSFHWPFEFISPSPTFFTQWGFVFTTVIEFRNHKKARTMPLGENWNYAN